MNQLIFYLTTCLFLILPLVLLLVRFQFQEKAKWWVIFLVVFIIGWLLRWFSVYFYGEYMCELASMSKANIELERKCFGDGAREVFALYFGGIISLIYFAPFLLVYSLINLYRQRKMDANVTT